MSLSDRISSLQSSAKRQLHALTGKKKTENALVLPFFEALGYNPFDLQHVEPDYKLGPDSPGTKEADYALKTGDTPALLVRCTEAETSLDDFEAKARREGSLLGQLEDLEADVVALTNGLTYRFYADLEVGIKAGPRPFLDFNLLGYEAGREAEELEMLRRLSRPVFDRDEICRVAHDRRAGQCLRGYLSGQRKSPDDHFVRFLAAQVYEGDVSESQLGHLRPLVEEVLGEIVEAEETGEEEGRPQSTEPENVQQESAQQKRARQEGAQKKDADQEDAGQGRSLPSRPAEPAASDLDVTPEKASAGDGAPANSTPADSTPANSTQADGALTDQQEDGSGPFDKNLAKRVIEEF